MTDAQRTRPVRTVIREPLPTCEVCGSNGASYGTVSYVKCQTCIHCFKLDAEQRRLDLDQKLTSARLRLSVAEREATAAERELDQHTEDRKSKRRGSDVTKSATLEDAVNRYRHEALALTREIAELETALIDSDTPGAKVKAPREANEMHGVFFSPDRKLRRQALKGWTKEDAK